MRRPDFAIHAAIPKNRAARRGIALAAAAFLACSSAAIAGSVQRGLQGEIDPALTGPSYALVDRNYASHSAAVSRLRVRSTAARLSTTELDPAIYGRWTVIDYPTPVRAIHLTLLHTGKVLLMAGSGNQYANFLAGTFSASLWNPETGEMTDVPPPWDMFCAGHVADPDGNVFVMGGTTDYQVNGQVWKGSNKAYVFNAETEMWEVRPEMAKGRWYPTAVLDPTGNKILVYAGKDEAGINTNLPEVYDRTTGSWSFLPAHLFPIYPGLLWTMKDQLFFSGAATGPSTPSSGLLSPYSGVYKRIADATAVGPRYGAATVFAGAVQNQIAWLVGGGFPATASTLVTDLKAARPAPVAGPVLPTAKAYVSAVNLPDLRVLETGGGTARKTPVYEASILDPATMTLKPVAPPAVGRTYHSSAILLPDGRVATFGGDYGGPNFDLRIEIYEPDYLFKGPRPEIQDAPVEVTHGSSYPVLAAATDASLAQAVLIRPSSTTHSTDANQRSILVDFTPTPEGGIITLPQANNVAPPGWYMLFVNDSLGRPSKARWIHLT